MSESSGLLLDFVPIVPVTGKWGCMCVSDLCKQGGLQDLGLLDAIVPEHDALFALFSLHMAPKMEARRPSTHV